MSYLTEAFKALDALNEDTFSVSDDGIKKLAEFEDSDDLVDEITVYDADAEDTEDLEDSYVGKVIVDCNVCHSKIYKDKSDVVIDEETQNANITEECPYCYSTDGFKVIGEVAPMATETEEKVEDDIEESCKSEMNESLHEAVDLLTREHTIASVLSKHMDELSEYTDANSMRNAIIDILDKSEIADKDAVKKLKRVLFSKKSTGALLSTIATYMTGEKVAKVGRKMKEDISDMSIEDVESFTDEVKKRFPGSEAVYDGDTNTIKITLDKKTIDESIDPMIIKANDFLESVKKRYDIDLMWSKQTNNGTGYVLRFSLPKDVEPDVFDKLRAEAKAIDNKIKVGVQKPEDAPAYYRDNTGGWMTFTFPLSSYGIIESMKEDLGTDIDEYQQWVDYDMKRYGKISDKTNDEIRKAGLQVIKDKYGDYQVIAGKYDESLKEAIIKYPNGMPVTDIDLDVALNYMYGEDRDMDNNHYTDDEKQRAVNYWLNKTDEENESLKESVKDITITTDDSKTTMTSDDEGKVTLTTEPVEEHTDEGEVIEPLTDETEAEIEANDGEENIDIEDFDEESFDELGEGYFKNVYENVDSFKTSNITTKDNKVIVEGVITFDNNVKKNTSFLFESANKTKSGKYRFIGENLNVTKGNKAFSLIGNVTDKKFLSESMNYNYRTKNDIGKSIRCCGTIKRG